MRLPRYSFAILLVIACSTLAQSPSLPVTAPVPPEAPPRIMEIPLLDCSGLPCIDMTTGSGKKLRLLIDTGEINSYLDSKVAQSLGIDLKGLAGAGDNSTGSEVQQTIVPGAKLGDLPMGDFPFMVLDMTPQPDRLGQTPERLPGDGALTFSAFKNRLLQLDFAGKVVRLSEPQEAAQPCPHACSDLVIKRFGRFGPATLTTDGFALNGLPVDVQIDTLFTGTMLVYPTSLEKLGLKKQAKSKHKEQFPFTQVGLKLARADGATESYQGIQLMIDAPLYFLTPDEPPPSVQFDATVGSGLLSRGAATFDFKGMHMWIESTSTNAGAPEDR